MGEFESPVGPLANADAGSLCSACLPTLGERFRRGDIRALAEILRDLCPAVRRGLTRKYKCRLPTDMANDLTLEALERAWENHAEFDSAKAPLRAWLWTIADHRAADLLRSRARRPEAATDPARLDELPDPHARGPDACLDASDGCAHGTDDGEPRDDASSVRAQLAELVHAALARVPERQRFVLLADAESRDGVAPTAELARVMGVAEATIRTYRQRGQNALKIELQDLGVEKLLGALRPNVLLIGRRIMENGEPL